jgi:light-regulated signal transduction histidine kinase (bacteriophytochrome)
LDLRCLNEVFDGAPNAILLASRDGAILGANRAAARVFGGDSLTAPGARLAQLLDPDETFEPSDCFGVVSSVAPVVRMMRFLDQLARAFEVRVTILPASEDGDGLLALYFHDTLIGDAIEDVLFVLKEDLVSLNEALFERNADLEGFASVAAHDLQDPLRKIAIFSDMLMASHADRLDGEGRSRLEAINATARRMRRLVDGLLLYARSSGCRLRLEDSRLNELVEDACDAVRAMIEETGARIETDALPVARVDRGLFVHVLQNLLTNAMKYRGEDAPVVWVSAKTEDDAVVLEVKDNGQGFDMKHHDLIFRSFARLHRRDEVAGDGIGLALCKRVVERHGGRIWAESAPGRGASFFVRVSRGRERLRAT